MLCEPCIQKRHVRKLLQDMGAFAFDENGPCGLIRADGAILEALRNSPAIREVVLVREVLATARYEANMLADLEAMRQRVQAMGLEFAEEPFHGVRMIRCVRSNMCSAWPATHATQRKVSPAVDAGRSALLSSRRWNTHTHARAHTHAQTRRCTHRQQ